MSVRLTVLRNIEQVAAEQDQKLAPLTDDLVLVIEDQDHKIAARVAARL